jgi:hypothetical protein
MSSNEITIKAGNQRIYQCPNDKKIALINKIIAENEKLDIIVVCSSDVAALRESLDSKKVKVVEDRELVKDKEMRCEFLIGYDMPIKAIVYMARVSRASQKAVMLLNESEQRLLHSIETLLGRAIKQESIEGFMYEVEAKKEEDPRKRKPLTKEQITEIARKRHEDATVDKPKKEYKDSKDFKGSSDDRWAKKKKEPNKFLGKDENGKAIFSGKSGDRNHRHDGTPKARFDAPKAGGKRISIKARKPKKD